MIRPVLAALAAALLWAPPAPAGPGRLFYPDDPIDIDPETEDASGVRPWNVNGPYDFIENSFLQDADKRDVRAFDVNTADEVPDSSWFTNRAGLEPLSPAEVATGGAARPADGTWTIVSAKAEGRSPGFVIRDAAGVVFFLKFDPPSNPEMASGAEVISTRILRAAGYHVPGNTIATLRRAQLAIDPSATAATASGARRPFTMDDADAVLARAAQAPDGTYRVLASPRLPGADLGPFRYHGTRPDDPNDIYPHEHRRELRGLRVFSAWLNHDDSRSLNTRDMLVARGGRKLVWHNLLDFGSTLGSGTTQSQDPRAGNEYIWESRPTVLTILTFGFYVRPWITVRYPDLPSIGRFEADFFQPQLWKPDYPNPAFDNARPDDAFWAARRVAAFTDDVIAALVESAGYSDARASRYLVGTLVRRRDKVVALYLNGVLPLVDCTVADAALTCRNAAIEHRVANPPRSYRTRWFRLDNDTGTTTPEGEEHATADAHVPMPAALQASDYVVAEIRADHPDQPGWATPLTISFRKNAAGGWTTVGITRQ